MTNPEHRRVRSYRREWARRLIARGNPPGTLLPAYGSAAWCTLPETDPARIAAVVLAAEAWAWQGDPLPELPIVRGDDSDRQGVATPIDQPRHPDPGGPSCQGVATPGNPSVRGGDSPRQGGHPGDETPAQGHGNAVATPGNGSTEHDQPQHPDQTGSAGGTPEHGSTEYDQRERSGRLDPPGDRGGRA